VSILKALAGIAISAAASGSVIALASGHRRSREKEALVEHTARAATERALRRAEAASLSVNAGRVAAAVTAIEEAREAWGKSVALREVMPRARLYAVDGRAAVRALLAASDAINKRLGGQS
jgi:hypothetical protein